MSEKEEKQQFESTWDGQLYIYMAVITLASSVIK